MNENSNEIKPILYLSFDVETDGSTPLVNNLLSIGIVGLLSNGQIIYEFEANILPLESHKSDDKTMEFWSKPENLNAWNYLNLNQQYYLDVFEQLETELSVQSTQYNLVFVAQPACFDWMFFKCYYELAKSNSLKSTFFDIGFKCTCISTLVNYYKNLNNSNSSIINKLTKSIKQNNTGIEHSALADAKIQGLFYCELIKIMQNS